MKFERVRATCVALGFLGLSACDLLFPWEDAVLPKVLGHPKLIKSDSFDGFREGCRYAIFKLSPETIQKIRSNGVEFLSSDRDASHGHPRNPYSPWMKTPIVGGRQQDRNYIYAYGADGGCNDRTVPSIDVERISQKPGYFYQLTANREGMIFVSPSHGVVVYIYFG
ncbi:hypothetical protein ABLE93_19500 [Xanthobacter sp. KR7-65]|uniref:hypothetical protein n=1 Tax=Xanthobacter sp. KR7-65 TaxID=3156612 RepID=UPI0032B364BC